MSVAQNILDAAQAALGNVTWSPTATVTIKTRKVGTLLGSETEGSGVTAVLALTGGETVEELTANQVLVSYPIVLEFAQGGGQKLGNTTALLSWREQARKALHDRDVWTSLAGWNQTLAQPLTPFDRSAIDKGVSLSLQRFVVEVIEDREGT